jgi:hypothetical protein
MFPVPESTTTSEVQMGTLVQTFIESSEKRLSELQPAIDEAKEIRDALEALGHKTTSNRRMGRRRRTNGNNRRDEFLQVVAEHPGIKIAEAAKKMRVNPNYLYRIGGEAADAGMVRKDGKQYFPAQSSARDEGVRGDEGNGDSTE